MDRCAFGEFVLDFTTREVLHAGRALALSPKALTLLSILVENRPRALSKQELQDRLWPGTFVVEKNLTNLVSEIREALGDDASHPRFIRTVPRFGYAFCETTDVKPALDGRRHNLPEPLTSFVGRRDEMASIIERLAAARLLTLTGAGGCGKTRLALAVAHTMVDRVADGAWLLDLGPLSDATLVPQALAAVLDVRESAHRSLIDGLAGYCRERQMLLVLDNCEHLIAECARLADVLLHAAPRLSILATSREALGLTGETIWRVPSLSADEAAILFTERARAIEPAFTAARANAETIGEICQRLDGIPLAIELAAARLRVLSLDEISARLNDRFRLLTGGSRTAVARQRTLEATVGWSYDLLTEPERLLLRRLSVFAGRSELDAIEEVCATAGIERAAVLDLLSRLVDKSLAIVDGDLSAGRHYRMLETVRQYARERLVQSGQAEHLQNRHLAYFASLVTSAEGALNTADQVRWLNRLQIAHDNLRSALEWGLAAPARSHTALGLASGLIFFWLKRGYFGEGQQWIERALAAAPDAAPAARAKALMALGNMTFFQGDFTRARTVLRESAILAERAGEHAVSAMALGIGGITALELGDLTEAAQLAEAGRAAAAASAAPWMQGPSLSGLAYIALHGGRTEEAGALHEEALRLCRVQGEKWAMSIVLFDLALLRVVQQRIAEARALCAEGVALCREFGDRRGIAWCLGMLAGADAVEGHFDRAARLRGAMERLLDSIGAPVQPTYEQWIGRPYFAAVAQSLGTDRYDAAYNEGRAMTVADAIDLALSAQPR